jgi:hypothetical protein
MEINLVAGWIAILAGLLSGAGIGLFFHNENWLGGYGSWQRRMLRLGHISLIGTGLLNILFALSAAALHLDPPLRLGSIAMLLGAVTMPTVCTASAFYKPARSLFFIPVLSLVAGTAEIVYRGLLR